MARARASSLRLSCFGGNPPKSVAHGRPCVENPGRLASWIPPIGKPMRATVGVRRVVCTVPQHGDPMLHYIDLYWIIRTLLMDGNLGEQLSWLGLSAGRACQPCVNGRGSARPDPKTDLVAGALFLPFDPLFHPLGKRLQKRPGLVFSGQRPKAGFFDLFRVLAAAEANGQDVSSHWLPGPPGKRPTGLLQPSRRGSLPPMLPCTQRTPPLSAVGRDGCLATPWL